VTTLQPPLLPDQPCSESREKSGLVYTLVPPTATTLAEEAGYICQIKKIFITSFAASYFIYLSVSLHKLIIKNKLEGILNTTSRSRVTSGGEERDGGSSEDGFVEGDEGSLWGSPAHGNVIFVSSKKKIK
jgi:hypothetical protein